MVVAAMAPVALSYANSGRHALASKELAKGLVRLVRRFLRQEVAAGQRRSYDVVTPFAPDVEHVERVEEAA